VVITSDDQVIVSDTGNKRIVAFDLDGNPITEFGEAGLGPGQFDEPVGLAADASGQLYVADTWNQRIQSFSQNSDRTYQPLNSWDIVGWYGQSLDNKPYLTADQDGYIYAGDPEGYRVLQFTSDGTFIRYWGDLSSGNDGFGLVGGLATDAVSGIWVVDTGNSRLMHFTLPPVE
jgi:sugar lactone lactonase YvrE